MKADYAETEGSTSVKRPIDRTGIELRQRAREGTLAQKREARAELRRRLGNLRGAVIPDWEREARGADPAKWDLVRS